MKTIIDTMKEYQSCDEYELYEIINELENEIEEMKEKNIEEYCKEFKKNAKNFDSFDSFYEYATNIGKKQKVLGKAAFERLVQIAAAEADLD